jgi:hypothetical protein
LWRYELKNIMTYYKGMFGPP